jgi:cobalt/nickel transport system permease protein
MRYPDIDRYAEMDSPIHHIEPRVKIISFGILIVSAVFAGTISGALFFLMVATVILLASRLPVKFILARMQVICVFVIPILILMPLTVPGTPVFSLGPLTVSAEGISFAVLVTIRSVTAILLVVTMLGTQRFDTTLKALALMRVPGIIIQMLLFTYRYIYVMIDEFLRIWSAMRAKGFTFRFSRYGLGMIGNCIGMLLIKSYERAERVYLAMIAKGYTGKPMSFSSFRVTVPDGLFCAAVIILAVAVPIVSLECL